MAATEESTSTSPTAKALIVPGGQAHLQYASRPSHTVLLQTPLKSGLSAPSHHENVCEYFNEKDRPVDSGVRGMKLASRSVSSPSL